MNRYSSVLIYHLPNLLARISPMRLLLNGLAVLSIMRISVMQRFLACMEQSIRVMSFLTIQHAQAAIYQSIQFVMSLLHSHQRRLQVPILMTESPVQIERNSVNSSIKYMGLHEFIPGVNSSIIADSLVIGESSWRSFVGDDVVSNYSTNNWIIRIDGVSGGALKALGSQLEADSRIGEVIDWKTEHESVERNGGLIFGTPGLLSLQFVVASIAAIASSFVFLSLVLNQRKKELAVLQAIGASPTQILRLVLFEILSIIVVSMLLGLVLGIGLAFSFNGFFDVFGFIFQLFGGASTNISRELVYPWFELALVSISVFIGVVIALLLTTRRALNSDLAMVLKGE